MDIGTAHRLDALNAVLIVSIVILMFLCMVRCQVKDGALNVFLPGQM